MVPVVTSRGGASRRRQLLLSLLLVASAALCSAVTIRVFAFHSMDLANLVWNLFLAWIPFVVALALYDAARRGGASSTLFVLGGIWLVFLPNAPYIATDVKYIGNLDTATQWYDPILIAGAAGLGLVLGFLSLYLVQTVVAERVGRLAGWTVAMGALVLSGLGVYLGRYERWNSWEVLTEPSKIFSGLASGLADPLAYPKPIALSAFFAISCCAGYAVFYSLFEPHLRRLEER